MEFSQLIDLLLHVYPVDEDTLTTDNRAESSACIGGRVGHAWARQHARQGKANARLHAAEVDRQCVLADPARAVLVQAARRLRWSSRGLHRVMRVARTIADLADCSQIDADHIAEAIGYRRALPDGSGPAD